MARITKIDGDSHVIDLMYNRSKNVIDRQERRYNELVDRGRDGRPLSKLEEASRRIYSNIRNGRVRREALLSTRKYRDAGRADAIRCFNSVDECQTASRTMEDVVMASPRVRQRYQRRQLEGYANTYRKRDEYANSNRHSNPLYRIVQNDVLVKEDDEAWSYSYALTEEETSTLTLDERNECRQTWAYVEDLLDEDGEDPTSQYGALL